MASPANAEVERTDGDTRYDLSSILFSPNRDYLIRNNSDQVKVDSLSGNIVGLYFSASWCGPCQRFTPDLVDVYNELLQVNKFEIVFVSNDKDNESFDKYFSKMPWLAIPFSDSETRERLNEVFAVSGIPHLVLLDENGKVLTNKGVGVIREHGVKAYPFTPAKFAELEEIDKARREAQTLESILVSEDCDFVIGKDGVKIPVSDLVGKTILLYFSAHWCPPCRAFLPVLMEAYKKINENGNVLEVVFISSDRDQTSFNEFFSKMPWLALPFGDKRKQSLSRIFKVRGIPMVVAIGPNGKTVSTEARELIMSHGAEAYPFTSERLKEIKASYEKMA
ncbi:Thioredoxin, nucleoredoxin [Handroanthus impetiginosus]|uniref:protein-disulfide reductase n=1 Tax=Handroanthus impetiginosus TaxID=429701 RepID=A0A2G9G2C7_9LAMI|nr:Thioredoxin, nucleoredoxin [Handroanthus impetiginosus]